MKKLMFATALMASAAAFADGPLNATSFEGYTAGGSVLTGKGDTGETGATGNYFCYTDGDVDGSLVKAFGGEGNLTVPDITRPFYYATATPNANYLELNTEGGILWRSINTIGGDANAYTLGLAQPVAADGTYLDTLVQFTATEDGNAPTTESDDKLAIWLNVDSSTTPATTNLMVKANLYDMVEAPSATPTTFTLAPATGTKEIVAGEWYRLTIKASPNVMSTDENGIIPVFEIFVDGVQMCATTAQFTSAMAEMMSGMNALSDTMSAAIAANKLFPSLATMGGQGDTVTLQGIGFKGSGALDDIVWTEENPFQAVALDFTLTWPAGVTPTSYTINGGEPVALALGSTSPFQVPGVMSGDTVAFTFTNADGATKTMSLEAAADATDIDASTATYVWADYLGDAVNGAYTIDDANDLDMLRKGVAANLATLGETFKQTANIDMTSADPFAGVGTYAANLNSGLAFQGTYDGQGFKIANITMTARNYGGVFNQVKGGTIKDLTVENITAPANATGEFGYAIVGNAGLGATLQGLTAMGSFGTVELPCSHNVAGIAIRVCGGASNVVNGVTMLETLVKDCTNNATLYGFYTKCGGITALTQDQNGVPNDYVLFDGCVNNANIAMVQPSGSDLSKIGRDGLGGILAYVADGTKMQNCVNNGTLTSPLTTAKIGGIVGWAQGRTLDDLGGNVASAAKKMIGDPAGSTITGFKYATVADNKATTVLPPLTVGATYLLEGAVGASDDTGVTLADGQTIAFDAALDNAYTFSGIVGAAAPLVAIPSTSGTITTFSAGYFPRTATAGQDGSAANPFELADADDLQALKAAFGTATYRAYNYKVVANIDATDLGYWDGIGTQGTAGTGLNGGTLDGSGYTISNLKYSAGKYRAFFNRLDNATIKDLTINVTGFEDTDAAEHGYAAFAGNMKGSLLLNCTATGTIGTTAKPAMHTCGGLAVKVDSVGAFVNCTNHIDIVCSLTDNPKIGGIVGLMQGGALTNCWNDGDLTITVKVCANNGNGAGGLVGYAQTTGYTISGGGNAGTIQSTDTTPTTETTAPIHVGTIVGMTGSALTAVDGVVAPADAVSAGVRNNVNGLDFATVDNNVATFVPNASLAAGNTYKVMLGGATATYAFTEAGTIAFDTNLVQDVSFNITGPEGLTVTDATVDGVVTFTVAAAGGYPTYLEDADADVKAAYDTWKVANGADTNSEYENQFLVNAAPATAVPATALAITAIEQNETAGWDITVECTVQGVDLGGTVGTAKVGNGYLAVSYAADLTGPWTTENIAITASANGKVTVNVNKSGAKFMKVKLSPVQEPLN